MNNSLIKLLVYESYAFQKVGGELRQVKYLLKHLDRTRFETAVVLPFQSDSLRSEALDGTVVSVIEPPLSLQQYGGAILERGVLGRLRSILDLLKYTYRMMRFIRDQSVDVIHCCSIRAVLLIGMAARLSGVPLLFLVNGRLNNPLLDAFAFAVANRIVFQCKANLEDRYPVLRKLFRNKMDVIGEGIDLAVIQCLKSAPPDPAALEVDPEKVNVIVLGFLNPEKGVHYLIDAFAQIRPLVPNVRLWVVGDQLADDVSDYRARLENQVAKLGLGDVVRFTGWRDDALKLLSVMDVLVHPSLSEGMPHAVLEAMALGKGVIATRVGCSREAIRNGENGLLVDPGDRVQLSDALARVIEDHELRHALGLAAAATIASKHDVVANTRVYENIVARLI